MEQVELSDECERPEKRGRRSWLFSGRPPSNRTVGALALVYGAVTSWWSESGLPFNDSGLWHDSPALIAIFLGSMSMLFLGALYFTLRVFLPHSKPRVTKRWRSQPLVMRTASLAQSIIFFRTLQALPALLTGYALGILLTAAAAIAGLNRTAGSLMLAILAAFLLVASLVAWKAKRDAERANYEPFVKIRW